MNNEKLKGLFDEFISSNKKHCLVIGSNYHQKHINTIRYLNSLGKRLKVLIRLSTMMQSEELLGFKAQTGKSYKIGNLSMFVDSMQLKSQSSTPREFNCVIVYPIDSLKGIEDDNIDNILNDIKSEKVFWVSCHQTKNIKHIKEICEVEHIIRLDNENDEDIECEEENLYESSFDYLEVESLGYYHVEEALKEKYKLGCIHSSSMGHQLIEGKFGKYTFWGESKTKTFNIKVKSDKSEDKYILLVNECKK